ncbi:tRNA uridine-5-carboxymethylaminomethyl(34) synthesis enzyme MnmG, partial [Flavobacteriaceae bacterium]|nr:tRNA uridine-5-carboxymethylaminomethyl(34) synthesis enzyme MnmG [Flavobacteriaceae bacterium]
SKLRVTNVGDKRTNTDAFVSFFKRTSVKPEIMNPLLSSKNSSEISQSMKLYKLFSRPNITLSDMLSLESVKMFLSKNKFKDDVLEQTEVQVKYSGYIEKEKANAEKLNNLENIKIPTSFNYSKVQSLSSEAIQKLNNIKPSTLSQASRISGVSPNDISVLMVYMGR